MEEIEHLKQLLDYIEAHSASTLITLAAVAFGFVCLRALYKSTDDGEATRSWPLPGVIISGLLLIAAQGLNWWHARSNPTTTARQAFVALKDNKRVTWLIRLIPYSGQRQPELSIEGLKSLGPSNRKYVFVADYSEVKNLVVSEAVYRMGLSLSNEDSVSAIVFPLNRRDLFPANARGLLQVIIRVDNAMKDVKGYKSFPISSHLDPTPQSQLADLRLTSWSWDGYSEFYEQYRKAVEAARTQDIDALSYIGTLGRDWHPAGYSQIIGNKRSRNEVHTFQLQTKNGVEVKVENFGSRAFLVENLQLKDIDNLVLIHFSRIDQDRIPDLSKEAAE